MRILYIYPYDFWGKPVLQTFFIRISNYLNYRKKELIETIEEEYLDLRIEELPNFTLENLFNYRKELNNLLKTIYGRFKFDLAAISCYSSFNYINTIEVAHLIKTSINPNCFIVVGGVHPSMCPEDFQPGKFSKYLYLNDGLKSNYTPFDYLIKEEGELTFFMLVKDLLNNSIKKRKNINDNCIIIEPNIIENLDDLPLINLDLFKKYAEKLSSFEGIYIDFSRGCIFKCKFCSNSENYIKCYKRIRLKTIEKCVEELNVIKNTNWISFKYVFITDSIFLPKRSARTSFFNILDNISGDAGRFPFQINIMDRVDLCSKQDLENYKKFNVIPTFGLETCSKKLLFRIGKVLGKTDDHVSKSINNYLDKFEEIIKIGNELDLPIIFNLLIGLPGSDKETIKENWDFFLSKRFNNKSLIETYKIILKVNKFMAYFGSELYNTAERLYGTHFYDKKWWKEFNEDQVFYSSKVDPSKELTLKEDIELNIKFIKEIWKIQNRIGNPYYSLRSLFTLEEKYQLKKIKLLLE